MGRTPDCYHIESCGKEEYVRLQMAVNSFTMDVYLAETNFEQSLLKAVDVSFIYDKRVSLAPQNRAFDPLACIHETFQNCINSFDLHRM